MSFLLIVLLLFIAFSIAFTEGSFQSLVGMCLILAGSMIMPVILTLLFAKFFF